MGSLDLVQLTALMNRASGRAVISLGLIDGPVLLTHPELASEHIREVAGNLCPQRQRRLPARNVADSVATPAAAKNTTKC
jgi:hypothetical protein